MKQLSDFELGFLVGIFEGEGYFGLRKNRWQNKGEIKKNAKVYARVEISITDLEVIENIQEILDIGNVVTMQPRSKYGKLHKMVYKLGLNSEIAIELADELYPHLSARRQKQIDKMKMFHKMSLDEFEGKQNKTESV